MLPKILFLSSVIALFSCGLNESHNTDGKHLIFDAITFSHNIFELEKNINVSLELKEEKIAVKVKKKKNIFKLKTKNKATFLGKKVFSLFVIKDSSEFKSLTQLHIFQKTLKNQKLIGLKSKFLSVKVQGEVHEMFFQEGFDKRAIESNFNREGIIFTYGDECKIQYNPSKKSKEKVALSINTRINEWLSGNLNTECIFDVYKFGKTLAIKELLNLNQVPNLSLAYYLNPLSNLIEPYIFLDTKNTDDKLSSRLKSDSTLSTYKKLTTENIVDIKNVVKNHKLTRFSSKIFYKEKTGEIKKMENCFATANFEQFFREVGGEHVLISKSNVINNPIIIPPGLQVKLFPGDKLDLRKGSFIISFSPIQMSGEKENPIEITSSDASGRGFHIINARQESNLKNVNFNHLSSLNYKSWKLPSAVTFYESPVTINFCSFSNNHCEDAINIFRSTPFLVNNSIISNTFSDAFDADFSNGTISNCKIINSGNDGIDISGSKVIVKNTSFTKITDKALSAGENSKMTIDSVSIDGSSLAIVAKDLSKIKINNANIINSEVVYCAFEKKSEFGASSISANNVVYSNFKEENLIEEGSTLKVDGEKIHNYRVNVRKYLYGNEYGKATIK